MPPPQALAIARQKGLDLVEISPTAVPPVCRIMDFGKYQYQEQKLWLKPRVVGADLKIGPYLEATLRSALTKLRPLSRRRQYRFRSFAPT